jgi:subtilisin family serine protease
MIDDFNGWDFLDNDNNPEDTGQSEYAGHGTHCAGIASAVTNNRIGIASIGYGCGIMPVRVGDDQGIMAGPQGIEYAARTGASVISCSWGPPFDDQTLREAVDYATERDALVVAAAGNLIGMFPPETPIYPAAYDDVIGVAASDLNDHLWEEQQGGSNYGNWVDITAPGAAILSTYLRNGYYVASGTSMATPLVAGVAVLLRAAFPDLTAAETFDLILRGADPIDDLNPRFRGKLGAGRVNALRALEADVQRGDRHAGRGEPHRAQPD